MTFEEKISGHRQLLAEIGQAEMDCAKKREEVQCLIDKLRQAGELRHIADKIAHYVNSEPSGDDFEPKTNPRIFLSPHLRLMLDPSKALAPLEELRKARQELVNLRQRNSLTSGRSAANTL